MKSALLLLSFTLAACAASSTIPDGFKAMPDSESRVSSTLPPELSIAHPALLRAWQGKDPMAMRPYYTDDAVVVTTAGRFAGWPAVHDEWLTPTLRDMSAFMAMPATFTREGEDIVEQGRYSFQLVQEGVVAAVGGIYAQRWQRQQNGMWRIVAARVMRDSP